MRRLAYLLLGVALTAGESAAQPARSRLYSTPLPPPRELLDRLNLEMSFRVYVPVDGRHDGLATVQLHGSDLYVQTRSGLVMLLDAETGATQWRQRVGRSYVAEHALAFNSREVYVVNNTYLYALDRRTGSVAWQYRLPEGVSSAPVADENFLFIPTQSGQLLAYFLPRPDLRNVVPEGMTSAYDEASPAAQAAAAEERRKRMVSVRQQTISTTTGVSPLAGSARESLRTEVEEGPRPVRAWRDATSLRLELPLLLTPEFVVAPTPNGVVLAMSKLPTEHGAAARIYRFSTDSPILAAAGYYEGTAYVGAADANVYAIQTTNGKLLWRHISGVPISRKPAVTDADVFVVSERKGMTLLDRATGEPRWRVPVRNGVSESNAAADRFLAVNPKYVYAADPSGRLLILSRRRGLTLSGFDAKDFVFPVSNETTDRLYLAANNGLIVCLHDREYARPIRHRLREEEAANPVRIRLSEPVDLDAVKEISLRDLLDSWTKRFPPLRFSVDEGAFRAADRELPLAEKVQVPKKDKAPLGPVLKDLLAKIKCGYEIVGTTVVIVPADPAAKP